MIIGREHLPSFQPFCWCWWAGWWWARPGAGSGSLQISGLSSFGGEEHTPPPKPAGFGYVGNILFWQGRGKIPTARDAKANFWSTHQSWCIDLLSCRMACWVNCEVSLGEKEQGGWFLNEACSCVKWVLGRVRGSRNHLWILCCHGEVEVAELGWGHLLWEISSPQRQGSLWYCTATAWPLEKYPLMLTLQLPLLCLLSQCG